MVSIIKKKWSKFSVKLYFGPGYVLSFYLQEILKDSANKSLKLTLNRPNMNKNKEELYP